MRAASEPPRKRQAMDEQEPRGNNPATASFSGTPDAPSAAAPVQGQTAERRTAQGCEQIRQPSEVERASVSAPSMDDPAFVGDLGSQENAADARSSARSSVEATTARHAKWARRQAKWNRKWLEPPRVDGPPSSPSSPTTPRSWPGEDEACKHGP